MRKPLALVAALLLTTSLAAACGDDGDDDAGDDPSTVVEGNDGADTDASTTTTAAGDTATTTGGATGGADPGSDFCDAARSFASDQTMVNLDFNDPDQVAHGVELLTNLRDAAPEDLQDDVQVVIDGFQAVAEAMAEAGDDPAAQQAAVEELQPQFEGISAASQAVQTYTQEQCGVDVSGGGTTDTTAGG